MKVRWGERECSGESVVFEKNKKWNKKTTQGDVVSDRGLDSDGPTWRDSEVQSR